MSLTRRATGYAILLLALLGLLLCLGGIAGTWWAKSRVDTVGAAVFKAADEAFGFVDVKLELIKQGLGRSRSRVVDLSRIAERLKNSNTDVRQECQPLLETLADIHQELKWAESWLDSSQVLADGINQISAAALSSDFAATQPDSKAVAVAREVHGLSASVADALAKLQALRAELVKLQESGVLARTVTLGIIDRVAVLDAKVADLSARIDQFDATVMTTRAAFAEQSRKLHWWTLAAAIALSFLPLWFGYSQIVVGLLGWRRAHPPVTPPPPAM